MFSDRFDVLMSKIIFKILKNFILIHFQAKNTLNRHRYHNSKQVLSICCHHARVGPV